MGLRGVLVGMEDGRKGGKRDGDEDRRDVLGKCVRKLCGYTVKFVPNINSNTLL